MLIKDESFRNLFLSMIVLRDEEVANEIARYLKIEEIIGKDGDFDNFEEKLQSFDCDEKINSLVLMPYVDHSAGMSFLVLTTGYIKEKFILHDRDDFSSMSVIRKDKLNNSEFIHVKDLADFCLEDFDINKFEDYAKSSVSIHNENKKLLALRFLDVLDNCRNEDFPDDILVIFFKEGFNPEGMWVRYEDIQGKFIIGKLLNSPNQDLGISAGDTVKFTVAPNEDGEYMCFSVLD